MLEGLLLSRRHRVPDVVDARVVEHHIMQQLQVLLASELDLFVVLLDLLETQTFEGLDHGFSFEVRGLGGLELLLDLLLIEALDTLGAMVLCVSGSRSR